MMAARGIVRTAHRSVLTSRALSSSRWSTATSLELDSNSKDNNRYNATSKRWFGLYRHEKYIADRDEVSDEDWGGPRTMRTAEDMEFYDPVTDTTYDQEEMESIKREKAASQKRDELDKKTGRGWTDPWEIKDEDWMEGKCFDDFEEWNPSMASRISLERVQVHPDGVPTLEVLASLALPSPPALHPGHGSGAKPYVVQRKQNQYKEIQDAIQGLVSSERLEQIFKIVDWDDKQQAIDILYETTEATLAQQKPILSQLPKFSLFVEQAMEEFLEGIQRQEEEKALAASIATPTEAEEPSATPTEPETEEKPSATSTETETETETAKEAKEIVIKTKAEELFVAATEEADEGSVPIFMDVLQVSSELGEDGMVPKLLNPLKPHHKMGCGRMVEEWELAALKTTKRIMIRQCTRDMAQLLNKASMEHSCAKIFVTGRQGMGKSASLAAIVASARTSGYIVMYMPDGDRMRKLGKYIEPSSKRRGFYDLPFLAKEVCGALLENHESDLHDMVVSPETCSKYLTEEYMKKVKELNREDASADTIITVVDLLKTGSELIDISSACYSASMDTLMNQTTKPFVIVSDEFNGYYDRGHYYHMSYDPLVHKPIPYSSMTLFEPLLNTLGVMVDDDSNKKRPAKSPPPKNESLSSIQRGGIVVGTTESRAVSRKVTGKITEAASALSDVSIVSVPPFSVLEAEHYLSNLDVTGIGRLRFDQGETVMNEQEMAYLRMVSSSRPQLLLDSTLS
uniref:Small ribosomal subunit protein mS29 n=1 Tax=Attheya septentrionalis TaxID=420275 RepID=A0A7S2XP72_9STRA|mmetsp:Transcript_23824/g.43035  ORF Transcript_23824/g.43035 Transcript_23824/m.43035 type:complete len:742 (+) Transcript_23824:55-2280(+)